MLKLFRCLTSVELNGWYEVLNVEEEVEEKNLQFARCSFLHLTSVKLNSIY